MDFAAPVGHSGMRPLTGQHGGCTVVVGNGVGWGHVDHVVGVRQLSSWGSDCLMWTSDYPHSVSTWPKSKDYISKQVRGLSPAVAHKLLVGNAVKPYHLRSTLLTGEVYA